jgi:thiamine-monophosphate kinase
METILTGGDDYEVLAALPADGVDAFCHAALAASTTVSEIGTLGAGEGTARFFDQCGRTLRLARPSFSHF